MIEAKISEKIHNLLSDCRLGLQYSNIKIINQIQQLDQDIKVVHNSQSLILETKKESNFDVIDQTRNAYKLCGKEPSRYRPSAEALLRRLRTGKSLYRVNNIVDTINLISMKTHFSIGGFDVDHIQGNIMLDVGTADKYQAIGRGDLNIEHMPGLRDDQGFFGTPTSDSERTKVNDDINHLLLVYYDFYSNDKLIEAMDFGKQMLIKHCRGTNVKNSILH